MRYIFTLKSALIILLVMFCCTMKAETVNYTTDDGFAYSLDTETQEASLIKYNGDATDVVIPKSVTYENKIYKVTSLGDECFYNANFFWVAIPSSVTSLGDRCFYCCHSLRSIKIPSSVTSLGNNCFAYSRFLTSIEIPSSVTSLEGYCFYYCTSLTSIKIPSSVTSLKDYCFENCTSLKTVICKMENVIEDKVLFWDTPITNATLYVPEEMLSTYQSTSPWSEFGTILPLLSLPDQTLYVGEELQMSANGPDMQKTRPLNGLPRTKLLPRSIPMATSLP